MQLSLGKAFGSFSNRMILEGPQNRSFQFQVKNSWFHRILGFFCIIPRNYSEENRRTIQIFRNHLIESIGTQRLHRMCTRMKVDLERKEEKGCALYSRDIAKIFTSIKDVTIEDVQELIAAVHRQEDWVPEEVRGLIPNDLQDFRNMDRHTFHRLYEWLQNPISQSDLVPKIKKFISGRPTHFFASYRYDPFLEMRERLQLCSSNIVNTERGFFEKFAKVISKRWMPVGTIVRAHNSEAGHPQYYRVASSLVTGRGMVSYILMPATRDMQLRSFRGNRGSDFRPAGLDSASCFVTDNEQEFGKDAFESGEIYEPYLQPVAIEVGHSLGGNLAQWRTAHHLHIRELHTYNAPGVSRSALQRFNANTQSSVHLFVNRTRNDPADRLGDYHLGYEARSDVQIQLDEYWKPRTGPDKHVTRHSVVFSTSEAYDIQTYPREVLDHHLNNLDRSSLEKWRKRLGSNFIAPIFYLLKIVKRALFGSRTQTLQGLHIESFALGRWSISHITQEQANQEFGLSGIQSAFQQRAFAL